jgi:hypothetical protein
VGKFGGYAKFLGRQARKEISKRSNEIFFDRY